MTDKEHPLFSDWDLRNIVLIKLHEIGYPLHWLSTILSAILENKVTTIARVYQSCPLNINELEQTHSPIQIDSALFLADLGTLVTMYQRIIPFGLVSCVRVLPPIDDIYEYNMYFSTMTNLISASNPVISILFFNLKLRNNLHSTFFTEDLRALFGANIHVADQDQETPQRRFVHKGLQIVSTYLCLKKTRGLHFGWIESI